MRRVDNTDSHAFFIPIPANEERTEAYSLMEFKALKYYDVKSESFQIHPENDDYAFLSSNVYKDIFGKHKYEKYHNGYLRLKSGKRKLYLRYHALSTLKKEQVALTYTNLKYLLPPGCPSQIIKIKKSCWFCFHAFNQQKDIKYNFWAAVISIIAVLGIEIPQFILNLL